MSIQDVLAPVFVQGFLTLGLLLLLGYSRFRAVKAGAVKPIDPAASLYQWPAFAAQCQRSFLNQFETPVLFYVIVGIALATKTADAAFVLLAWLWVATRIVHALVHVTVNRLSLRFPIFIIGVAILVVMWIVTAVRIYAV